MSWAIDRDSRENHYAFSFSNVGSYATGRIPRIQQTRAVLHAATSDGGDEYTPHPAKLTPLTGRIPRIQETRAAAHCYQ